MTNAQISSILFRIYDVSNRMESSNWKPTNAVEAKRTANGCNDSLGSCDRLASPWSESRRTNDDLRSNRNNDPLDYSSSLSSSSLDILNPNGAFEALRADTIDTIDRT